MPTFSAPSSAFSSASSSSRLPLLFSLLAFLQLLMSANSALLLPLDSTLFAPHNGPFVAFYRRPPFPNAPLTSSSPLIREFNSAGLDLSRKRSLHAPVLPMDEDKFEENGHGQFGQLLPFQLSPIPSADGKSLTIPSADQSNTLQCFCCRAFVCRKQICPCSKFMI
ncbi:hypothetical protein niasHT_019790 [Heterodera trifolii]|uniref:Effector protein n=1 Tax=Heterodera trifolii TaxID=157864 RepID=A0ABD2LC91_9BILA